MLAKDFPIYFDDTLLFKPDKWDETYDVVENEYQTEAGTDQVDVVRTGKLSVSAQFNCSSKWAVIFAQFSNANSIKLRSYDLASNGYKERTVRMREFKPQLESESFKAPGTHGLYQVTFTLKEF